MRSACLLQVLMHSNVQLDVATRYDIIAAAWIRLGFHRRIGDLIGSGGDGDRRKSLSVRSNF